jgi:hypothetical protein
MDGVRRKNAARLRELIAQYGWPAEDIAGRDDAEAAWLIAQHAVGEPDFQGCLLALLGACIAENRLPAWHAAYLEDRIALHERRSQRYGTQWVQEPANGRYRPWALADADRVNDLRGEVGLGPMRPTPKLGPARPPKKREQIEWNNRWWQEWLMSRGWRGWNARAFWGIAPDRRKQRLPRSTSPLAAPHGSSSWRRVGNASLESWSLQEG